MGKFYMHDMKMALLNISNEPARSDRIANRKYVTVNRKCHILRKIKKRESRAIGKKVVRAYLQSLPNSKPSRDAACYRKPCVAKRSADCLNKDDVIAPASKKIKNHPSFEETSDDSSEDYSDDDSEATESSCGDLTDFDGVIFRSVEVDVTYDYRYVTDNLGKQLMNPLNTIHGPIAVGGIGDAEPPNFFLRQPAISSDAGYSGIQAFGAAAALPQKNIGHCVEEAVNVGRMSSVFFEGGQQFAEFGPNAEFGPGAECDFESYSSRGEASNFKIGEIVGNYTCWWEEETEEEETNESEGDEDFTAPFVRHDAGDIDIQPFGAATSLPQKNMGHSEAEAVNSRHMSNAFFEDGQQYLGFEADAKVKPENCSSQEASNFKITDVFGNYVSWWDDERIDTDDSENEDISASFMRQDSDESDEKEL